MARTLAAIMTTALTAATLTALSACATPESNPHYRFSTKYPAENAQPAAQSPAVQQASYVQGAPVTYAQSQTPYAQANVAAYPPAAQHAAHSYDNQLAGAPVYADAPTQVGYLESYGPAQSYSANTPITQSANQSQPIEVQMVETGGQNGGYGGIYLDESDPAFASAAPAPYQAPAQSISASASIPAAPMPPALGVSYIVQEGDTAYSLSRKTCSSVSEIRDLNRLDSAFTIRAGEAIRLPQSRC